jgi:hypothetical protein
MAKYAVVMQRVLAANTTVGVIAASNVTQLRRIKLYDFTIGVESAPASFANLWLWKRFTAAGTSTAVTPNPLDLADTAMLGVAGQNNTVEPTYTVTMAAKALNQQATYRWLAAPGSEIIIPATNAAGLGIMTTTTGSTGASGTVDAYVEE